MIRNAEQLIDMAAAAYIQVYGFEKWSSLTDQQKHDAVMTILNGFNKVLDR